MRTEPAGDYLFHHTEAVERIARIRDAPRLTTFDAILLDITPGQRRAAEHDRHGEALPAHLLEVLAHYDRRFDEQPRHADGVRLVGDGGFEDRGYRLLDPEIDDPIAVVGQDDVDEVLADVVDIAAHRRQDDRAFFLALDPLHVRFEIADRRLHRLGRLQHERELHLAGAEQIADRLH